VTYPTALSIQPAAPVGISREAWYLLLTSERNDYEERQQHTCYLEIEETNDMIAAKLKGTVTKDYRLELKVPRSIPPGEVEVIVLHPEPSKKPKSRARKLNPNIHPAAGLWADRPDIGDTVEFVSQLRRRLETRHDARR